MMSGACAREGCVALSVAEVRLRYASSGEWCVQRYCSAHLGHSRTGGMPDLPPELDEVDVEWFESGCSRLGCALPVVYEVEVAYADVPETGTWECCSAHVRECSQMVAQVVETEGRPGRVNVRGL